LTALQFDIFRIGPAGDVRWLEVVRYLKTAKARAHELAANGHGGFLILDHSTGNELIVDPEGTLGSAESAGASRRPTWRELYRATVLETDLTALQRLLLATEHAIFLRLQALVQASDAGAEAERQEIADASGALLVAKSERLGWPNWKTEPKTKGARFTEAR
jgi:hypothetical protein